MVNTSKKQKQTQKIYFLKNPQKKKKKDVFSPILTALDLEGNQLIATLQVKKFYFYFYLIFSKFKLCTKDEGIIDYDTTFNLLDIISLKSLLSIQK